MTEQQLMKLLQELQICKNEIAGKLEEIRLGIIDVEIVNEKILSNLEGYGTPG